MLAFLHVLLREIVEEVDVVAVAIGFDKAEMRRFAQVVQDEVLLTAVAIVLDGNRLVRTRGAEAHLHVVEAVTGNAARVRGLRGDAWRL